MWLKICGITLLEDARAAVRAGADAVGFVFWAGSPRRTTPEEAGRISRELPREVERAGVFVNAGREEILRTFERAGLSWVQLHGSESLELARSLGVPWVKALHVRGGRVSGNPEEFAAEAFEHRFLLDAYKTGIPGGTGATFSWDVARRAGEETRPGSKLILAGGLDPSNIAEACRIAKPAGVDVSSGVERVPGVKDEAKLEAFARALSRAELARP